MSNKYIGNLIVKIQGKIMDLLTIGLIIVAGLAVLGLGIRVAMNFKNGNRNNMKNIQAGGDVVGRDKVHK